MATNTRTNLTEREQRNHDRKALIQWVALGLVAVIGLLAAFFMTEGGGGIHGGGHGGGHSGAPAVVEGV